MAEDKKSNKKEVVGMLMPSGWTESGEVTGLKLCCSNEQEYLISDHSHVTIPREFLREWLRVFGNVESGALGDRVISIETFDHESPNRNPGFLFPSSNRKY